MKCYVCIDPSIFHAERPRWSWSRCFQYPWIPRCQRLFSRGVSNWRQPEPRMQHQFPAQNMLQPPINRQQIRFSPQTNSGNFPFQVPNGFRPIPDISQIQPVCNVSCFLLEAPNNYEKCASWSKFIFFPKYLR